MPCPQIAQDRSVTTTSKVSTVKNYGKKRDVDEHGDALSLQESTGSPAPETAIWEGRSYPIQSRGIREPKGRVKGWRVEIRPSMSTTKIWVGTFTTREKAKRAFDVALHITGKDPYYFTYPDTYFPPRSELWPQDYHEQVQLVKSMAKSFSERPEKFPVNPSCLIVDPPTGALFATKIFVASNNVDDPDFEDWNSSAEALLEVLCRDPPHLPVTLSGGRTSSLKLFPPLEDMNLHFDAPAKEVTVEEVTVEEVHPSTGSPLPVPYIVEEADEDPREDDETPAAAEPKSHHAANLGTQDRDLHASDPEIVDEFSTGSPTSSLSTFTEVVPDLDAYSTWGFLPKGEPGVTDPEKLHYLSAFIDESLMDAQDNWEVLPRIPDNEPTPEPAHDPKRKRTTYVPAGGDPAYPPLWSAPPLLDEWGFAGALSTSDGDLEQYGWLMRNRAPTTPFTGSFFDPKSY